MGKRRAINPSAKSKNTSVGLLTLFIVLSAWLSFLVHAIAQVDATTNRVMPGDLPPSTPLRAGVEFSEKIQPLDPVLWPGNSFDKDVATALLKDQKSTNDLWIKIPAWQAGAWETTQATNTRSIKYENGQPVESQTNGVYTSKGEFTWGEQMDQLRGIWHHCSSGFWSKVDHGTFIGYSYVKSQNLGTTDYPSVGAETIVFDVDKATNKITDVQQRKTWGRFIPVTDRTMKQEHVHTVYDEHGDPENTAWNTSLCKRKYSFKEYEGKTNGYKQDRADFIVYLNSNGLNDLIPTTASLIHTQSSAESHFNQGIEYDREKQYQKAITEYNQAIQLNPNYADAYAERGNEYSMLNKYQKALADYNTAIKLNPKDPLTYQSRAETYGYLQQYQKAIADCTQAIKLAPTNIQPYIDRGMNSLFLHQYQKTIHDCDTAINLPRNSEQRQLLGEQIYKRSLAQAYTLRSMAYKELGQKQKAQANLAKAKQLDPSQKDYAPVSVPMLEPSPEDLKPMSPTAQQHL